jgi:hypothetical protein
VLKIAKVVLSEEMIWLWKLTPTPRDPIHFFRFIGGRVGKDQNSGFFFLFLLLLLGTLPNIFSHLLQPLPHFKNISSFFTLFAAQENQSILIT